MAEDDWKRDEYSTDCPRCGKPGQLDQGLTLYFCPGCNFYYHINPPTCQACGTWIANGFRYCSFHKHLDGIFEN